MPQYQKKEEQMSLIKFKSQPLVDNSGFESGAMSPWSTYKNPAVTATFTVDSAAPYAGAYNYKAAITDGGTSLSWIQLGHNPALSIINGGDYRLSFAAKAQAARDIQALLRQGGTPWANYGLLQTVTLTTGWVLYSYDFAANATALDAKVKFYLGADNNDVELDDISLQHIINFSRNPIYGGLAKPYTFRQPRSLSDGGTFYSYNKGVLEEFIELKWKSLPLADWLNLDHFLRNSAVGSNNTFTYTDQDGVAHSVRLESTAVDFREVRYQRYAGSLILRKVG